MIARLDNALMHLAKKIILIAAFLGISRWQLIVGWIRFAGTSTIVSCIIAQFLPGPLWFHILMIMSALSFAGAIPMLTNLARNEFREDDILSRSLMNTSKRVCSTLLQSFVAICLINIGYLASSWLMLCFGIFFVPSPHFYDYFLINQSPQNPVRLRNLIKNAFGRIASALRPSPQPTPIPIAPR